MNNNKNTKDLGIIQIKLSNDSLSHDLVQIAKQYASHNPYSQVCFFNSFCDMVAIRDIPVFHLSQSKLFCGNLLVTDIESLELCLHFPMINNIIYFMSYIPWLNETKNYKDWEQLFYSEKLKIIASNKEIGDIFELCYKKPNSISERLDYEKIQECL